MDTFFAPAERVSSVQLRSEIELVTNNPIVNNLMTSVPGLFMVLDEHRQIVATNKSMLKLIGAENVSEILGMRPGDAIKCIYSDSAPNGCGTTEYCSSCGAAVAIVLSLATDEPVEKVCNATVRNQNSISDICFKVRCAPVHLGKERFLLLFMQDVSRFQNLLSLERVFFHDVSNVLMSLVGHAQLLLMDPGNVRFAENINEMILRLKSEVEMQRGLLGTMSDDFKLNNSKIFLAEIDSEIRHFIENHPTADRKIIEIEHDHGTVQTIYSDRVILMRVLTNMVINACEASSPGERITIRMKIGDGTFTFSVWNKKAILDKDQTRIFKKYFSTKSGDGRGLGTYSMKLFGEQYLKGKMDFSSDEIHGTEFILTIPVTAE